MSPIRQTLAAALILALCLLAAAHAEEAARPRIVFLGDSLTAGYGLPPEQSYVALIQQRLDAAGLAYETVNAGVSGDTTAGALRRLNWVLRRPAAVVVICLGGNDGLRGLDLDASRRNLEAIIDTLRQKNPEVRILLAGMQIHPNMGKTYAEAFRAMYPAIAQAKDVSLLPFMLVGVADVETLNQADGIHPNAEGQRRVADTVYGALRPLLDPPPEPAAAGAAAPDAAPAN